MSNQVFSNEHKSTVETDHVFYGKMDSSGRLPGPRFKQTENPNNPARDYGNQYTQKIQSWMVNSTKTKNGTLRK